MNLLLWLRRFRHRCGYGIHSPWVYTLVSDVILQRMPYYAYDSLPDVEGWRRKDLQLLLRLANHFQPDEVEVKGYGKLSADWLKAGRREFALSYTEGMPPLITLKRSGGAVCLIMHDCRSAQWWEARAEQDCVSLDLHYLGLIYRGLPLPPQHHKICYT